MLTRENIAAPEREFEVQNWDDKFDTVLTLREVVDILGNVSITNRVGKNGGIGWKIDALGEKALIFSSIPAGELMKNNDITRIRLGFDKVGDKYVPQYFYAKSKGVENPLVIGKAITF